MPLRGRSSGGMPPSNKGVSSVLPLKRFTRIPYNGESSNTGAMHIYANRRHTNASSDSLSSASPLKGGELRWTCDNIDLRLSTFKLHCTEIKYRAFFRSKFALNLDSQALMRVSFTRWLSNVLRCKQQEHLSILTNIHTTQATALRTWLSRLQQVQSYQTLIDDYQSTVKRKQCRLHLTRWRENTRAETYRREQLTMLLQRKRESILRHSITTWTDRYHEKRLSQIVSVSIATKSPIH